MRNLIIIIATLAVAMAGTSCLRNDQAEKERAMQDSLNRVLGDSLATALAEKDSLMVLMNDINDGLNEIKNIENIVAQGNIGAETPDRRAKLREDIILIRQSIEKRRERLAQLEAKLANSSNYSAEMQKTIENLKKQLEDQQSTIENLTKELEAAHVQIGALNTRVDSLRTENAAEAAAKRQAQEESARLTTELNTCYFVVGTKKELKDNKIIETGFLRKTKIMQSDYEKSYFTRADKRTLNEIPLRNKKAQVMSKHPTGTYDITQDENGLKTLRILDKERFWELSNFLIVKVG
ncbi:MAG: hypothetical protein J6X81_02760 [Muribaculaceae bacterium]|nr:hypothetical protein [Muribaculaceae bacterium]